MSLGALPAAPLRVPPERAPALLAAADLPTALAPGLADFAAFLACAYLLSSVTLAMGLVTSSSVASHVGPADRVLRPRQGHHGQGRSLHGERGQILGLQTVHIGLAAGPRHHLTLDGEAVEEVVDALRRAVRVEPLAQHRILGRHADGAPADVWPGAGAALHAVDINAVGAGFGRHAHIVIHARRTQLELDRDLPVGGFTDLLDLEREVIGTQPVRMARG